MSKKTTMGMAKLILSQNAKPGVGGQGLNLVHMYQAYSSTFDVGMYCKPCEGFPVEFTPSESSIQRFLMSIPYVRRMRDLHIHLGEKHFDTQVAANLGKSDVFQGVTGQCLESLEAARRNGSRCVVDNVTTHASDFRSHQVRECAKFGIRPTMSAAQERRSVAEYERADVIRVMSHVAKKTFLAHGIADEKVFVANPPTDLESCSLATFDEPVFRISFVGLIEPAKGFHYLVDAFNKLNKADSELALWGGPGSRAITNYLSEKQAANPRIKVNPVSVREHGYGNVYGKSSVLVHPSLADGFGYVVAEAMGCGIPVIVTENTGAADIVKDGENGFIVSLGDSDAIHDRLKFLVDNPAKLKTMGAAARAAAETLTVDQFRDALVAGIGER